MGFIVRAAVVGCGYWGSKHVRVLSTLPSVSQVVAIDGRCDLRDAIQRDFPSVVTRAGLTEALDDFDALIVATPPASHFDLAAEAIAAGKHVLVEKPMTTCTAQGRELVRMAAEANVVLAVGHTFVHNAAVEKLTELIANGDLGKLHYIEAARLNLGLYRDDVNVLWDLAAHDLSILTALLDQAPDTVSAWGGRHTQRFAEDVATMRMLYEDLGVESTVRASWLDPVKVRRMTAVGSNKMAVYNDVDTDERIKIFDRSRHQHINVPSCDPEAISYHFGDITCPHIDFGEPLQRELADFIDCSTNGGIPVADGMAGLTVVAVLEASDRSLSENGAPMAVELPPFPVISKQVAA